MQFEVSIAVIKIPVWRSKCDVERRGWVMSSRVLQLLGAKFRWTCDLPLPNLVLLLFHATPMKFNSRPWASTAPVRILFSFERDFLKTLKSPYRSQIKGLRHCVVRGLKWGRRCEGRSMRDDWILWVTFSMSERENGALRHLWILLLLLTISKVRWSSIMAYVSQRC